MATLDAALEFLVSVGLLDVMLPFILVFTIVYAMLERTAVLGFEKGKPRKSLNAMVGFVLAFLTVASLQQVQLLQTLSSLSAVGVIIMLAVILVLGILGVNIHNSKLFMGVGLLVFLAGLLVVLNQLGVLPPSFSDVLSPQYGAPILVVLVFFAIAWYVVSGGQAPAKTTPKEEKASEAKPSAAPQYKFTKEIPEDALRTPGFKLGR